MIFSMSFISNLFISLSLIFPEISHCFLLNEIPAIWITICYETLFKKKF